MFKKYAFASLLLFLYTGLAHGQFPTGAGTTWEYFQYFQTDIFDTPVPQWAFVDSVVGDTLVDTTTYQVVRRSGTMYNASGPVPDYDTLEGTWYYRVATDRVLVLDSVVSGQSYESLLHDWGLAVGDTSLQPIKSLIELTPHHGHGIYLPYYSQEYMCTQWDTAYCDLAYVLDTYPAWANVAIPTYTWGETDNRYWTPELGTVLEWPFAAAVGVFGQHAYLGRLTTGGNVVYLHSAWNPNAVAEGRRPRCEAYPNPATAQLRVRSEDGLGELRLHDALGRVVAQAADLGGATEHALSVGELPRGQYWLVVGAGERRTAVPVLLQ